MNHGTRLILRADAIFDLSFGALMFLTPWIRGLFDLLDLPKPQPEVFTQVGGGLLIACAYLLWISPGEESVARPVAFPIGLVTAVGVILLVGWLIAGDLGVETLGTLILAAACAILVVFSVVELWYANLPGDQSLKPQLVVWGTAYFGELMRLRVQVRDSNKLIETHFVDECVLGRGHHDMVSGIDLGPFEAVELGVSRKHAKLTRQSATIMVQDLGSTNGTYLNGQKLPPYQPRVLRNADELRLGNLVLRVSFMRAPK